MIFTPSFTVDQSADGKTITYTNTSNFSSNDEGYVESDFTVNQVELKDAYGDQFTVIQFPTSGPNKNIVKLLISKDQWIDATLRLEGPGTFTKFQRNAFYRIYMQAAKPFLQAGCCQMKHCDDFGKSQLFKDAAVDAIPIGDSVEFQENIDAANAYLKASTLS